MNYSQLGTVVSSLQFAWAPSIILLLGVLYIIFNMRKSQVSSGNEAKIPSRVEEIPSYFYLGRWVPSFIDSAYGLLSFHKGGMQTLHNLTKKFSHSYYIQLIRKRVIFIKEPVLIQKILGSNSIDVMKKPEFFYNIVFIDSLRNGLISSKPEVWQHHRKILNRSFTYKLFQTYMDVVNKHSSSIISTCPNKETIPLQEMHEIVSNHSMKIISDIIFGNGSRCERESELLKSHVDGVKEILDYKLLHKPVNLIPPVWWLNPKRWKLDKHLKELHTLVEDDIDRIFGQASECRNNPQKSMMEEMVCAGLTVKEIQEEVATFLIAGHETNVSVMNFFFQLIAENPSIQLDCQKEIDSVWNSKNGNHLSFDDLTELKCLERCINETLRLAPGIPFYLRELTAPLEIDGFKFPDKTIFCFAPYAIHRAEKYFPEPDKFDPDRWLPENVVQRPACSFIPFAFGARNCIGQKLAMVVMKVILASILEEFKLKTEDEFYDIKLYFNATIVPERNYNVTFHRRQL